MRTGIDLRLPYYQMGGISRYAINLSQALAHLPGEEQFILFKSRKDSRDFIPIFNPRFSSSSLWTPCHHRWERWSLALELQPHRLDVFHSPDFIPPSGGARRRIITIHDLTFMFYPEFLTEESKRYYLDQIRWATAEADHISVDSEATRTDLINLLAVEPEKVSTIYLAAGQPHTIEYNHDEVDATLASYNLPRGFILSVGTLEPRKNIPTLVRAYHQLLHDYGIDIPLVLVGGKGWMYEQIFETIDKMGLMDRVLHIAPDSDRVLAHLYRGAGVLAFPSFYEGFGFPVLEAMHARCPVLISDRGSLVEIAGEAAIKLNPEDSPAWAAAIHQVLTDSSLSARMVTVGWQQAQKFTWEKAAAATLALYRDS